MTTENRKVCLKPHLSPRTAYQKYRCRCDRCTENERIRRRVIRSRNPESTKAGRDRYRNKNRQRLREMHFKYTYDLTVDQIREMGPSCMVCHVTFSEKSLDSDSRNVDHNHITGQVRGVLCHRCNVGLGQFKDSPALLISAANYLVQQEKKGV